MTIYNHKANRTASTRSGCLDVEMPEMKTPISISLLTTLGLLLLGCGRSVTLQANSEDLMSGLEHMNEARQHKEEIFTGSLVGGLMVANAMAEKNASENKQMNTEKIVAGALGAGALVSSMMPDPKMGSYQLQEYSSKENSWNAVFTQEDFQAKVKLKEGNDQMTTVKVYANESETTNLEDFVLVLKKWAESL